VEHLPPLQPLPQHARKAQAQVSHRGHRRLSQEEGHRQQGEWSLTPEKGFASRF